MKKLFVVDIDNDFEAQVKSVCPLDQVEIKFFSSSMEIFSLIKNEKPHLIFLNLDVPDLNDFVMYDLLKKTVDKSIPVVVTYTNQSEKDLQQYKKLKFQARGYCKKPISNDDIYSILQNHLELVEEDDEEFSDENIDRLVHGDIFEIEVNNKDDTAELPADTKNEIPDKVFDVDDADDKETGEKITGRADKELRNQVIALERQNEFLRSENKELSQAIEELKAVIMKGNTEAKQLKLELRDKSVDWQEQTADKEARVVHLEEKAARLEEEYNRIQKIHEEEKTSFIRKIDTIKNYSQKLEDQNTGLLKKMEAVEKEKSDLAIQVKEITDQLTDKEKELAARDHQFELSLKEKADEMVQEAEDRLFETFRRKEDRMNQEFEKLREEKTNNESSMQDEIESLKQNCTHMQNEIDELKKREDSLNRTVSMLAEEKVTLTEQMTTMEENISSQQEEFNEKENTHLTALENLNKEMEKILGRLQFYKNRVNELGTLLQQALALTRTENLE